MASIGKGHVFRNHDHTYGPVLPDYLPAPLFAELVRIVAEWEDIGDDEGELVVALVERFVQGIDGNGMKLPNDG